MAEIDVNPALTDVSTVDQLVKLAPLAEHVVPLAQTFLWVLIVAFAMFLFRKPLSKALSAITKRIESGGGMKAGMFEMSEFLPQDAATQKAKLEQEVAAASADPAPTSSNPDDISPDPATTGKSEYSPRPSVHMNFESKNNFRSKYLQAEDLALRALQSEYNVNIMRQVSGGVGLEFDGMFILNGTNYVVEVKYLHSPRQIRQVTNSVLKLVSAKLKTKWPGTKIIIVVVLDSDEMLEMIKPMMHDDLREGSGLNVIQRFFSLTELQMKFGVDKDGTFHNPETTEADSN